MGFPSRVQAGLCLILLPCLWIMAAASGETPITEATVIARAGPVAMDVRTVLIRMILAEGDAAVKRLLTRRLVETEAARRGVTVTAAQLDATLKADLAQYRAELGAEHPEDAQKFTDDQLIDLRFHLPLKTYRERELYYGLLLQGLVVGPDDLTADRLRAWYAREKDRYGRPTRYQVRHILVKYAPDPEATLAMTAGERDYNREWRRAQFVRAQKKAEQIFELIKAGQSFDQLEKKYSEESPEVKARGGALPPIDIHSPVDATFLETVRQMGVGQCSPPVVTSFGVHLIYLDKIDPGQSPAFEEIAGRIQRDCIRQLVAERAAPLVDRLARTTEVTHLKNLYPGPEENLAAATAAPEGRVALSDCLAVLGRVPAGAVDVPLTAAVTRREFYAELWRASGRRFIEERAAMGLYLASIRGTPAEPSEIEVSQVFSEDQIQCYALQDRAIAEAKQRGLPVPERRKFYDYMLDLTHRTPAELKADAGERAALWKFMQVHYPWTNAEIEKYFFIERERYDVPGELKLSLILIRPQTDPACADPEQPSRPAALSAEAGVEQWQTAAARARTLYERLRGAGLPADADSRLHPEVISWERAAKRISDAPEEVTAVGGEWPPLAVVRVPRVDELTSIDANRSGYELAVLDFDPTVGHEALALADGQITAPIKGREGYYLLKRTRLTQPYLRTLNDPEVYRQVERDCITPRIRKNLQPTLDVLLKKSPIAIDEPALARLQDGSLR